MPPSVWRGVSLEKPAAVPRPAAAAYFPALEPAARRGGSDRPVSRFRGLRDLHLHGFVTPRRWYPAEMPCWSPGADVTKCHGRGRLKRQQLLARGDQGQGAGGAGSPGALGESAFMPQSGRPVLPALLGLPWLGASGLQRWPPSLCGLLFFVSLDVVKDVAMRSSWIQRGPENNGRCPCKRWRGEGAESLIPIKVTFSGSLWT